MSRARRPGQTHSLCRHASGAVQTASATATLAPASRARHDTVAMEAGLILKRAAARTGNASIHAPMAATAMRKAARRILKYTSIMDATHQQAAATRTPRHAATADGDALTATCAASQKATAPAAAAAIDGRSRKTATTEITARQPAQQRLAPAPRPVPGRIIFTSITAALTATARNPADTSMARDALHRRAAPRALQATAAGEQANATTCARRSHAATGMNAWAALPDIIQAAALEEAAPIRMKTARTGAILPMADAGDFAKARLAPAHRQHALAAAPSGPQPTAATPGPATATLPAATPIARTGAAAANAIPTRALERRATRLRPARAAAARAYITILQARATAGRAAMRSALKIANSAVPTAIATRTLAPASRAAARHQARA